MQSTIANIFTRELQTDIESLSPLSGAQNIVYRVAAGQKHYVLRLNKNYLHEYAKERWAMQQATRVGIDVPQIYAIGQQDDYDYMVMAWIEGMIGTKYQGSQTAVYERLGIYAQKLATIQIDGYGWQMAFSPAPHFTQSWAEAVDRDEAYIFGSSILENLAVLSPTEINQVRRFMHEYRTWDLPSRLSHNDLCLDNIIITPDDRIYLIDWSNACGQPAPMFEIARVGSSVSSELLAAFIKGYGIDDAEWKTIAPIVDRLKMIHALRAVVWAAQDAPDYLEDFTHRAKTLMEEWP